MEVFEDSKTVFATMTYLGANLKKVMDMATTGYEVIITKQGKPAFKINSVKMSWNGLGFVSE